jgi:hypothetical protein
MDRTSMKVLKDMRLKDLLESSIMTALKDSSIMTVLKDSISMMELEEDNIMTVLKDMRLKGFLEIIKIKDLLESSKTVGIMTDLKEGIMTGLRWTQEVVSLLPRQMRLSFKNSLMNAKLLGVF